MPSEIDDEVLEVESTAEERLAADARVAATYEAGPGV